MDSPLPSEIRSPATDSNQPSRANSVEDTSNIGTPQQHGYGSSNGADTSSSSSSDPNRKPELPDGLEQRIADDPYDADAWLTLLNEAERESEVAKVRDVYERFLKVYPTSVSCPLQDIIMEITNRGDNACFPWKTSACESGCEYHTGYRFLSTKKNDYLKVIKPKKKRIM
ncbi:hypothetical protein EDD21DRAFT_382295, partial [Dissophora ornata]